MSRGAKDRDEFLHVHSDEGQLSSTYVVSTEYVGIVGRYSGWGHGAETRRSPGLGKAQASKVCTCCRGVSIRFEAKPCIKDCPQQETIQPKQVGKPDPSIMLSARRAR